MAYQSMKKKISFSIGPSIKVHIANVTYDWNVSHSNLDSHAGSDTLSRRAAGSGNSECSFACVASLSCGIGFAAIFAIAAIWNNRRSQYLDSEPVSPKMVPSISLSADMVFAQKPPYLTDHHDNGDVHIPSWIHIEPTFAPLPTPCSSTPQPLSLHETNRLLLPEPYCLVQGRQLKTEKIFHL
jgi:hypothetical protein